MKNPRLALRFGQLIQRLRHAASLSQEELADHCGLHRTYIGAVERGEKMVTIDTADKLATAFDLTLAALLEQLE